jgi:hypothetical protein
MPGTGLTITNTFATQSGNVPASQLDTNFSQLAAAVNSLANYGNYFSDSGAVNAMVITVASPLVVAYAAGLPLQVKVAVTNTGAMTLNVNSLGAVPVTAPNGSALAAGTVVAGAILPLQYDGTKFQYLGSITPATGVSSITAGAGIGVNANTGAVTVSNTGVTSAVAGAGIGVSAATGAVTFSNSGVTQLTAGAGINLSGATGNITVSSTGGGSSGSFTGTLNGMSGGGTVTGTINYAIAGDLCTLFINSGTSITGTSAASQMQLSGLPAACQPSFARTAVCILLNNGNYFLGQAAVLTSGVVPFSLGLLGGLASTNLQLQLGNNFLTTGTKGLGNDWYIVYPL